MHVLPLIILDDNENKDMDSGLDEDDDKNYVSQSLDAAGVSSIDVS